MKTKTFGYIFPVFCLAVGASGAWAQEPAVDCSTAEQDIATLQHEKKATDERKVKGVMSILPIGIVINAAASVADDKSDAEEMHIDEYNQKIDERIAEIKEACNIE